MLVMENEEIVGVFGLCYQLSYDEMGNISYSLICLN